jgi:hypothetical protein
MKMTRLLKFVAKSIIEVLEVSLTRIACIALFSGRRDVAIDVWGMQKILSSRSLLSPGDASTFFKSQAKIASVGLRLVVEPWPEGFAYHTAGQDKCLSNNKCPLFTASFPVADKLKGTILQTGWLCKLSKHSSFTRIVGNIDQIPNRIPDNIPIF